MPSAVAVPSAAVLFALLSRFVGVQNHGGEEEAAIRILAALDEDPGARESRAGRRQTGRGQSLQHVARHGQIHMAGIGSGARVAAHAQAP